MVGIRRRVAASVALFDFMTRSGQATSEGMDPREKEAIKTKHVVRPRPHQGHRDSFPSTVSTQSLSPLFSPPTHHPLRPPLTQSCYRLFPHRCNPSLSRSLFSIHHINLCTAGSNDKRTSPHPSSFPLRLLNPSRTHQLSLYNGYTRPHQRCKDKSCVFRILCAHTCPSPLPFLFPSARAHRVLIPFFGYAFS